MTKPLLNLDTALLPPDTMRTHFRRAGRVQLHFEGAGRTKQSFREECDINTIMRRYQSTGVIDPRMFREGVFADATGQDYQEAMLFIADAKAQFLDLPAEIRSRFENNPSKLLDFVHDPKNRDEAVQLGFLDASKLPKGWGDTPAPSASPAASQAAANAAPAANPAQ